MVRVRAFVGGLIVLIILASCQPVFVPLTQAEPFLTGAQFEGGLGTRDRFAVANRVYEFSLAWDEIETSPGVYSFPAYASDSIQRLDNALGRGNYQLIIGVKTCPAFYASNPAFRMSPPTLEHAIDFARFIEQVVLKYRPWGIEVWNEPEFELANSRAPYFGGYGVNGGVLYGQTVRVIYDYLNDKEVYTNIVSGGSYGLLNPPNVKRFLADAVNAGMVSDYWSFHAYFWYSRVPYYDAMWNSLHDFSNEVYEIFPVMQIVSETSILYSQTLPEDPDHRQQQADYLSYVLRVIEPTHMKSILWYTLANNGWQKSDLVFNNIEYPAYLVWVNDIPLYKIFLPVVIKNG